MKIMVFGWGKKKPKLDESGQTVQKEKQITLSKIPEVLDEIKKLRTKTIISEAKFFQKNFDSGRERILKIANELEKDNLNVDDIDKHLEILVVRGKKLVISTIKREASEKFSDISSYDDIIAMDNHINQMLKRIGDVLGRQSRVIHIFAKKYASKLKEHLAALNSHQKQLQTLINNQQKLYEDSSLVMEQLEKYDESNKKLKETKQRLDELKKSLEKYDITTSSTKDKIEKLKSSEQYLTFLNIKKEIGAFSSEQHEIKTHIDLQFTKISRPLTKYVYISSLDKSQKKLMETLAENPFQVLTSSNKDNIVQILYAVRRGVEAGSVSVKDSEKSVNQIDETIVMLDDFISKIEDFLKRKKTLESKLDVFDIEQLKKEESILEKASSEKIDISSKIKNLQKTIDELNKSLPNIVTNIQENLRNISSTKYQISI
jgi:hypothetical protein